MTAHSILGIPIRFLFAAVVYTCISLFRIYFFLRLFRTDVGYYKSFCHAGEVVLGSRVFDPTIRMFLLRSRLQLVLLLYVRFRVTN